MGIKFATVFVIFLLLCSCSQRNSEDIQQLKKLNAEYSNKIEVMEKEIRTLKEKNTQLDVVNSTLTNDNYDLENKNSELEHSKQYFMNLNNDSLFSWIYTSDWNHIKIHYNLNKSEKEITSFKIAPYTFIGSIRKGWGPEAMDKGVCSYEFIQDDKTYQLEIFKDHIFKYQNEFYYSENNLFDLYDSFISVSYDWLETDNVLNLIYNSKMINMDVSYFITDRTKSIAQYVSSFQSVAPPKNKVGKLHEIIKCYYHGEVISIYIYDNYLSILHNNVYSWYKGTDEYIQPSGIISIINAG